MYAIINNGEIKGFCDTPRYIRSKNGIYVNTRKDNAEGVAIGGEAYRLENTLIKEVDGSEVVFSESVKLKDAEDNIRTTEQEITDLEIESMEQEQAITDHDIAIMELQEIINA